MNILSISVSFDVLILVGRVIVARRKLEVILLKKSFKVSTRLEIFKLSKLKSPAMNTLYKLFTYIHTYIHTLGCL